MNYEEITQEIYQKRRFGKECGRDVMKKVLPLFDHPEQGMKLIHVAGTNGKGSTCAMMERILREFGFRVGLFTSPHLIDYAERIKVNGVDISHEDVVRIGEEILEKDLGDVELTMFDVALLMGLIYFKEQKVDYVILETGLGGKMDSTAGLSEVPLLSVITRIGFDHIKILGDSLYDIAKEKAGILKPGTTLILAENDSDSRRAIYQEAEKLSVPVMDVLELEEFVGGGREGSSQAKTYQEENMATALLAIMTLLTKESLVIENQQEKIARALEDVHWPGRLEIKSIDPFVLVDGAHNPQGVQALKESLVNTFSNEDGTREKFILVTGVLSDKDATPMVFQMAGLAESVYTVTIQNPRTSTAEELADLYRSFKVKQVTACENTEMALKAAMEEAGRTGRKIVCFGSLYFVGEVEAYFAEK